MKRNQNVKRAAVLAWTAVSATVIIGFAALAVDMGYLNVVHTQMQSAADAGALAGASALMDSSKFNTSVTRETLVELAKSRAQEYCAKNKADGKYLELLASDILVGYLPNSQYNQDEIITATANPYNACRITVKKEPGNPNGPVPLFFATLWGKTNSATWASATAVIDDHISGVRTGQNGGPLIPVSVRKQKWIDEIINQGGQDAFRIDLETGEITPASDGTPEISIYPEKQKGKGGEGSDGAGNFGLLNFENGNNSVNPVGDQIRNGISSEEMNRTIGSDTITFYDNAGNPISYGISGTPGLKASLKDDFSSRLGDVIGFFIHTEVTNSGANCVYNIVDVKFGRLLYVNLNGSQNSKAIVIQPVAYKGPELMTNSNAPRNETAGKIKLVR